MTKITKQDIEQILYDLTGNDKSARGSVDYTMFILNQYMLSEVLEVIGCDNAQSNRCDYCGTKECCGGSTPEELNKLRTTQRQAANKKWGNDE